jgi:hypothetical protein
MTSITLLHGQEQHRLPILQALAKCRLFQTNSTLATSPYTVRSPVSLPIFHQFLSALEGADVAITPANHSDLSHLSAEFGFDEFTAKLSASQIQRQNEAETARSRLRIAALEESVHQHDRDIAGLNSEFARLSAAVGRLTADATAPRLPDPSPQLSAAVAQLQVDLSDLKSRLSALSAPPARPTPDRPRDLPIGSTIISDFPAIFAEFSAKRFQILWRGSRDGFKAFDFHVRCDGHANTLTVILDTDGNIFGGFTPVAWESRVHNGKGGNESNCWKGDDSGRSFLFTLKNRHNVGARRFALKEEMKHQAIVCNLDRGPHFSDIGVTSECNANSKSFASYFGMSYTNDTGVDGGALFTRSKTFKVKEIEVFEIID